MTTSHDPALADSPTNAALIQYVARWVDLFNAGDLVALADLYEPDSVVVPQPGHPVSGEAQSAALAQFMGLGVPMKATLRQAYTANDIALLIIDWRMEGIAPDGRDIALHGTATDIARRSNGRWRYVIDNPSGIEPEVP